MAGRAPKVRRKHPTGRLVRFAIVAARFNERMTKRLVEGALGAFRGAGLAGDAVEVHWVPGSFELPQAASHLAVTGRYAGIVCVGVVIRGQTPHFEHVAREAAAGIRHVALATGVPATFGVVTALSEEQAWARAGGDVGNRGEEAAEAALELAEWIRRLRDDRPGRSLARRAESARAEPRAPREGRASRSPVHLSRATRRSRRPRGTR
jgi:6,7-dimethyl-8-ribityllumazine synthase